MLLIIVCFLLHPGDEIFNLLQYYERKLDGGGIKEKVETNHKANQQSDESRARSLTDPSTAALCLSLPLPLSVFHSLFSLQSQCLCVLIKAGSLNKTR